MANPSPGAKAHPEHTVTLSREGRHVTVAFAGRTVADTHDAITLNEAGYPPVLYVPRGDVAMQALRPSDRHTRCPFKGEARYWSLSAGGENADNAVWAYDAPYDEVAAIAGHLAFVAGIVQITQE